MEAEMLLDRLYRQKNYRSDLASYRKPLTTVSGELSTQSRDLNQGCPRRPWNTALPKPGHQSVPKGPGLHCVSAEPPSRSGLGEDWAHQLTALKA